MPAYRHLSDTICHAPGGRNTPVGPAWRCQIVLRLVRVSAGLRACGIGPMGRRVARRRPGRDLADRPRFGRSRRRAQAADGARDGPCAPRPATLLSGLSGQSGLGAASRDLRWGRAARARGIGRGQRDSFTGDLSTRFGRLRVNFGAKTRLACSMQDKCQRPSGLPAAAPCGSRPHPAGRNTPAPGG